MVFKCLLSFLRVLVYLNSALSAASAPELRAPEVNRRLAQEYPDARCALDYDSPLQLLIATVQG